MTPVKFSLVPFQDVSGSGPRWMALSDEPWFELCTDTPLGGACIRLDWSAGLFDPVCRLVVRFVRQDRTEDFVLGGASFGRNCWIGRIPVGTTRILLSPMHTAGEFGFRIDRFTRMPFFEMMALAFRRRPINALLCLTARLRGWHQASESELREIFQSTPLTAYDQWRRERLRAVESDIDGNEPGDASRRLIAVLLPLERFDATVLKQVTAELSKQDHTTWRLLVAAPLESAERTGVLRDPRIQILSPDAPIAESLQSIPNDALVHVMHPEARFSATLFRQMAQAAARKPNTSLLYCDEDRYRPDGQRCSPQFKGDFDPLLAQHLDIVGVTGFWVAHRLAGHLRDSPAPAGAARALQAATANLDKNAVLHIARALVSLPERVGVAHIVAGPLPEVVPARAMGQAPFISVILPTRDRVDLLKPCIDSLFRFSRETIELIIVDNGSTEPETQAYFEVLQRDPAVKILRIDTPFNYSDLCNRGVAVATASRLLFLNNDTEFLSAGWEDIIAPYLDDRAVGAVGAKLLYGNGRVQHAGVITGLHGRSGHFEIGMADDDEGYFHRANLAQQTLAITAACLAVRRDAFEAVGGFDAVHLPVDLNDMDLCLRLCEQGYTNLYLPAWKLAHHESATRGRVHESDRIYGGERAYFVDRWLAAIRNDPAFNVNLSLWRTSAALG
jgi:GT2 family glycosyltransferase